MQDIHTHLYWESYAADRDQVVERAREAGVRQMIVVGCDPLECRQALDLTRQYTELYASVGIHPNEFRAGGTVAEEDLTPLMGQLEVYAQDEKVVAIGECGLDYSESHGGIDQATKAKQKEGFLAQLRLAERMKLPVIIHCRTGVDGTAYEDMLLILQEWAPKLSGAILHCYMGNTEVTQGFLKLPKVFFSFTGNITYPVKRVVVGTKDDLTETVKLIPPERLFIETDCPFLSPQAKRGERNEPAYIVHVAEKVSELLNLNQKDLEKALDENFQCVFMKVS